MKIWIGFVLCIWFALLAQGESMKGKPNVIMILVDDLGYHDLGIHGSEDVKSPSIDKLARDGVILTDGYAPHHFCGPSRSGLLSGINPFRIGTAFNSPKDYWDKRVGLPDDLEILPQTMQKAGYTTWCVGKWHLGHTPSHHPKNRGFNGFFGFLGGDWKYKRSRVYDRELDDYDYIYKGFNPVTNITYVTDDFTDAAIRYMSRSQELEKPFFLYLSYNAPHGPYVTLKSDLDPTVPPERRPHVAMIKSLDRRVRRIRRYLDRAGLTEETIIMFTSDNGGHKDGAINYPLTDYKGSYREGGLRVPWFITWPGVIKSEQTLTRPASHLDIYPTLQKLARVAPEKRNPALVGTDLMPSLQKVGTSEPERKGRIHPYLAFGGPNGEGLSQGMIRQGKYKLLGASDDPTRNRKLFDLSTDISERTDLSKKFPRKAERMNELWNQWNENNIAPLYPRERVTNPLRLDLSVVMNKRVTTQGSPISFQASGSSVDGETVNYLWETFEPERKHEAKFRDVWSSSAQSTARGQSSITITYSKPGKYFVRVNIETERWLLWRDVKIVVRPAKE